MPTARYRGCVASVGKNLLYAGTYSPSPDPTNAYRMEMLIGTLGITNAPTVSPTVGPCTVTAPTNGALGTCTSSLAAGLSCQFTCDAGYGVSGATSCVSIQTCSVVSGVASCSYNSVLTAATCTGCAVTAPTNGALGTCTSSIAAGTTCQFTCSAGYTATGPTSCSAVGVLTAATCAEPWTTKRAMPRAAEDLRNACAGFGDMYYMYHGTPYANTGELSKYATLSDVWTTGKRPLRPPWCSTANGLHSLRRAGGVCAAKAAPYQDLSYLCTATHGDGIYQFQASPFVPTVLASTQKYNAQADVWTTVRRIPTFRMSFNSGSATAVTVESGIHVLGGDYSPPTVARMHEMYYPVVDIWTTKSALPTAGSDQAGGAWGSTVMLAGGNPYSNQFHRYSAVTDTWTSGECLLRLAPSVAICMRLPAHTAWRASASVLLQA